MEVGKTISKEIIFKNEGTLEDFVTLDAGRYFSLKMIPKDFKLEPNERLKVRIEYNP